MEYEVNVTLTVEADSENHALITAADRLRDLVQHDSQWEDVLRLEHRGAITGFRFNHRIEVSDA